MSTTRNIAHIRRFVLVSWPRRPADRYRLDGDYVELVWAELLGPAATAVARRIAHHGAAGDTHVPIEAISTALGITPRRAVEALRRLHHHGLIAFAEADAVIATTGHVPGLSPRQVARLSRYATASHVHLTQTSGRLPTIKDLAGRAAPQQSEQAIGWS
ncbi:MAG: hypothetical protein ACRD0G_06200 [Acidimicrobiales bacterium]